MTITVQNCRVVYTGNGATTNWAANFSAMDDGDVEVYLYEIATGDLELLSGAVYNLNGVPGNTFSVDYPLVGDPIESTHKLIIMRVVDLLQPTSFSNAAGFDPATLTLQLDEMVRMTQQLSDASSRSLQVDISGTDDPAELLEWVKNQEAQSEGLALLKTANLGDVPDIAQARENIQTPTFVATRTALKALDTTKDTIAFLTESGRAGTFVWRLGDYAARIAADTQEGIYVKADAIAAATGAWVRQYSGPMNIYWFGATGDGAAFDDTALAGLMAVANGWIVLPTGRFKFANDYVVDLDTIINFGFIGAGENLTDIIYTGTGQFLTLSRGGLVGALASHCSVLIANMTLRPTTTHQAKCFKIELEDGAPSVGSYEALLRKVLNVTFMGEGVGSGIGACWSECINWYNAAYSTVENMFYRDIGNVGVGILYSGTRSAVDHTILNYKAVSCDKMIQVTNEVQEGIFVSMLSGVAVNYGVHWVGTTPSPLLLVDQAHLNILTGGAGIYLRDVTAPIMSNVNVYLNGTSIAFDYDNDAVYYMGCQWSNCSVYGISASANKTGVKLGAGVRGAAVGGITFNSIEFGVNAVASSSEVKLLPSIEFSNVTTPITGSTLGVADWSQMRERLRANLELYVRTDGTVSTSITHGRSNTAAAAFLTAQAALNYVLDHIDLGGFNVTINLAAGTYAETLSLTKAFIGRGSVKLKGDTTTPSNVVITGLLANGSGVELQYEGINWSKGAATACVRVSDGAKVTRTGNSQYSSTSGGHHILAENAGLFKGDGAEIIQGTVAGAHFYADGDGIIDLTGGGDGTMSGTFTCAFFAWANGGSIKAIGNTYSGTVTGTRYHAALNAKINTNGGGASYFPGSIAGTTATGGQYA